MGSAQSKRATEHQRNRGTKKQRYRKIENKAPKK